MQIRDLIAALENIVKEYGDKVDVIMDATSGEPAIDDITTYEDGFSVLYL